MDTKLMTRLFSLLLLGGGLLLLLLWWRQTTTTAAGTVETESAMATEVIPVPTVAAAVVIARTPTLTPTLLPTPLPPATSLPTSTPSPTVASTATPSATATVPATPVPAALRCPEEARGVPEYDRYMLGTQPWPAPDAGGFTQHFWLAKPLPGGGRLLTNQWFPYGYDAGRYLLHTGTDVAEDLGTRLLAAANGTVVVAGPDANVLYGWRCDWYGELVVLELDQTWLGQPVYVLYGHVLNITVEVGQRVVTGEQVAEIGVGGAALLPHLHLEVRVGDNRFGSTRNPMLWFDPGTTRGVVAGRLLDAQGRPWQGVGITAVNLDDGEITNTWSYLGDPDGLSNPDEQLAENFVFSDLRPGSYRIVTRLGEEEYAAAVTVSAGTLSTVEIRTER